MPNLTQILITLALSIVPAIIAALVTVRLSLSQFRSQRWWEKKAETYSSIIEHLSRLEYYLWVWLGALKSGLPLSESQEDKFMDAAKGPFDEIMKASSVGAFLVSNEAASTLLNLRRIIEEQFITILTTTAQDIQSIERVLETVRTSIRQIREFAKADLKR